MDTSWDTDSHRAEHGGETAEQVAARIVPAVQEALDSLTTGETGVLVLHGACVRVALAGVLGWPLPVADALAPMDNCGWAVLLEPTPGRLALVFGAEGDGLSARALEAADRIVTIPMAHGVDSLNVAAAAAVVLYALAVE